MKYVFFDTETTGLPIDQTASYKDIDNWPRLVQLSWITYDNDFVSKNNYIIKPNGYSIPESATLIHGISNKQAIENGVKIEDALNLFINECRNADALIGHNVSFDIKIVQSELFRLNLDGDFNTDNTLDTMLLSIDYCKIPNRQHGFRYPKLIELYNKLFSESYDNIHSANADVEATAKCFWAMIDRGIIDKKDYPCLLLPYEKQRLAEQYNKEAIKIQNDYSRPYKDSCKEIEQLFLKSAKLGNVYGMLRVAGIYLEESYSVHEEKKYDAAIFWLKKISNLPITLNSLDNHEFSDFQWKLHGLNKLVSVYKELGNEVMSSKYQKMLCDGRDYVKKWLYDNRFCSENHFYTLVHCCPLKNRYSSLK